MCLGTFYFENILFATNIRKECIVLFLYAYENDPFRLA